MRAATSGNMTGYLFEQWSGGALMPWALCAVAVTPLHPIQEAGS
jgi:hypothetical protein